VFVDLTRRKSVHDQLVSTVLPRQATVVSAEQFIGGLLEQTSSA